jgi:hypothetical protein
MLLLPPDKYPLVREKIRDVRLNNLFARAVIEKHVTGRIYADSITQPSTFYVIHPYGISLLFGDYTNVEFNKQFRTYALNLDGSRNTHEWLQTYPREWDHVLQELFGDRIIKSPENGNNREVGTIELFGRVNFRFNRENYLRIERRTLSASDRIVETDSLHFQQMPGSVIPLRFWDSADDFLRSGKGFTLLHKGEIASTAYSAFVIEDMLEIGIETVEKCRGFGFAEPTCCALIDYCLEHGKVPVWSCRLENTASYKLALKLGFEPVLVIPFYRLIC